MLKVVGTSDEVTSCECCGKQNLKKTVALMDDEGNVRYYGCNCAAQAICKTGKKITSKDVRNEAKSADTAAKLQARADAYNLAARKKIQARLKAEALRIAEEFGIAESQT